MALVASRTIDSVVVLFAGRNLVAKRDLSWKKLNVTEMLLVGTAAGPCLCWWASTWLLDWVDLVCVEVLRFPCELKYRVGVLCAGLTTGR